MSADTAIINREPIGVFTNAPDTVLSNIDSSCSLWWTRTPMLSDKRVGFIGNLKSRSAGATVALLEAACAAMKDAGVTLAVGPVDGSTWHSYRLVTWSSGEAPFFLEPTNPVEPQYFAQTGFETLAHYYSAITDDLADDEQCVASIEEKLTGRGITIRSLDTSDFQGELSKVFRVCERAFQNNFLYAPTSESMFIEQYARIRQLIDPSLVLLAERQREVVGFVFALPDLNDSARQTAIVKTLARLPEREFAGLGHLLLAQVQRQAHALGYKRAIHALMHQSNDSVALSNRYARIFRRYELFSRTL
jgi:predicted N-acetyltransferase YhbS